MPVSISTPSLNLGRHVFGAAALALGLITLAWHDYNGWHLHYLVYPAAAAEIFGGAAIQFRQTAKTGAVVLGAVYLVFALLCLPGIIAKPQIYNSWGNFFEQFSLVSGAVIVYARLSTPWSQERLIVSAAFFWASVPLPLPSNRRFILTLPNLVPKWLPPSQMFWAVTTTVLFALAAVALLANRIALLATRLLTMMLVIFGLVVWVPLLLSDPHNCANWSETAETFACRSSVDSR